MAVLTATAISSTRRSGQAQGRRFTAGTRYHQKPLSINPRAIESKPSSAFSLSHPVAPLAAMLPPPIGRITSLSCSFF